jgi:hypothetical protein
VGFDDLKARHSVVWGTGPYERVSATLADMQNDLVAALAPAAGVCSLDAATGTGTGTSTGAVAKRAARWP